MNIKQPYLLFLGDAPDELAAKTAIGVHYWRPDACVGQVRLPGCQPMLELPELSLEQGAERGAQTLLIGVANRGGVIPDAWHGPLLRALELGMDLASGLHTRLQDVPQIAAQAADGARALHDVRHPTGSFAVASGEPRAGRRVLTVGTDCSVGKMYTSLAIEQELRNRGKSVDFRGTGQTGILISGNGVSVDAVVADFISGATEALSPANAPEHWDVIEGQGSLFHPSYAGVSLGLLHGAQPEALVLCHEPTRAHMRGLPGRNLPTLGECMQANLDAARVVAPHARFVGIAINTKDMQQAAAHELLETTAGEFGLPAVDPVRTGVGPLVDNMLGSS